MIFDANLTFDDHVRNTVKTSFFHLRNIAKLQLVQNSAARILPGTSASEHITPTLEKLHWLPVSFRIDFKILLLTYKALNNLAPQYLCELLTPYTPTHALRSSEAGLLSVRNITRNEPKCRHDKISSLLTKQGKTKPTRGQNKTG